MIRSSFSTSVALNFGLNVNMLGQSQPEDLAVGKSRAIGCVVLQVIQSYLCYGTRTESIGSSVMIDEQSKKSSSWKKPELLKLGKLSDVAGPRNTGAQSANSRRIQGAS